MAKKLATTETTQELVEETKVSKLDSVFAPFLPTHHVSFSQLKQILAALVNGDDSGDDE